MEENELYFTYKAGTEIGSRKENQDNYMADLALPFRCEQRCQRLSGGNAVKGTHIFAVCDGVASLSDSSRTALTTLECIKKEAEKITDDTNLADWLMDTLDLADEEAKTCRGANTVAVLIFQDDYYLFGNVGDSPCFLQKADGEITELSLRHNMLRYKEIMQQPTAPGDARVLLFGIGIGNRKPSAVVKLADGFLTPGDRFILCTDGVSETLDTELLFSMLDSDSKDILSVSAKTKESDNCTAVAVCISEKAPQR